MMTYKSLLIITRFNPTLKYPAYKHTNTTFKIVKYSTWKNQVMSWENHQWISSWIYNMAGCWLFIKMISKDEKFAHVECRYSWPLNSIVLKPGKNMRTLVILNKSDKVMSGFKEISATDCIIVCNFQYILLFWPLVLIINCLVF